MVELPKCSDTIYVCVDTLSYSVCLVDRTGC